MSFSLSLDSFYRGVESLIYFSLTRVLDMRCFMFARSWLCYDVADRLSRLMVELVSRYLSWLLTGLVVRT